MGVFRASISVCIEPRRGLGCAICPPVESRGKASGIKVDADLYFVTAVRNFNKPSPWPASQPAVRSAKKTVYCVFPHKIF